MPESKLHKRARRLLRPGDRVGQPFGEALTIVDTVDGGNVRIKDGPAKGREVDAFTVAPEGYRVAVEFKYKNKVAADKIELFKKDGRYPVLEVDLLDRLTDSSDDELRDYIAGGNISTDKSLSEADRQRLCNPHRRWLYIPSLQDICCQFALGQDNDSPFGSLRCCVPKCTGHVSNGVVDEGSRYRTLPRFACAGHAEHPSILTLPEGVQGFPWVSLE